MREGASSWGDCLVTSGALSIFKYICRVAWEVSGTFGWIASASASTRRVTDTCESTEKDIVFGALENLSTLRTFPSEENKGVF